MVHCEYYWDRYIERGTIAVVIVILLWNKIYVYLMTLYHVSSSSLRIQVLLDVCDWGGSDVVELHESKSVALIVRIFSAILFCLPNGDGLFISQSAVEECICGWARFYLLVSSLLNHTHNTLLPLLPPLSMSQPAFRIKTRGINWNRFKLIGRIYIKLQFSGSHRARSTCT